MVESVPGHWRGLERNDSRVPSHPKHSVRGEERLPIPLLWDCPWKASTAGGTRHGNNPQQTSGYKCMVALGLWLVTELGDQVTQELAVHNG